MQHLYNFTKKKFLKHAIQDHVTIINVQRDFGCIFWRTCLEKFTDYFICFGRNLLLFHSLYDWIIIEYKYHFCLLALLPFKNIFTFWFCRKAICQNTVWFLCLFWSVFRLSATANVCGWKTAQKLQCQFALLTTTFLEKSPLLLQNVYVLLIFYIIGLWPFY